MKQLVKLLVLLLPYKKKILLGVVISLIALVSNFVLLGLSSWFISSMALAGLLGVAIEYNISSALIRGLALVRSFGRYAERLVNHDTTLRILGALRKKFYTIITPLVPTRLWVFKSGDLLGRAGADIELLDDFYIRALVPGIVGCIAGLGIFLFYLHYDVAATIVITLSLIIAGFALPFVFLLLHGKHTRTRPKMAGFVRSLILEQGQGLAELSVFDRAWKNTNRIYDAGKKLDQLGLQASALQAWVEAATALVAGLAAFVIAVLLAQKTLDGIISGPALAMLTVLALAVFEMIPPIQAAIQKAPEIQEACKRLDEIMDMQVMAVPNKIHAQQPQSSEQQAVAAEQQAVEGIKIDNLWFRYTNSTVGESLPWVLRDLSLRVPPSQCVGLRGPSGSGKSSLIAVLLKLWPFQKGNVLVHNKVLINMSEDATRLLYCVVSQNPHIFHATIRENLLFALNPKGEARLGGSAGNERDNLLWEALRDARLEALVRKLPKGLDSIVGESGRLLSSGEIRRLAVARAFLRQATSVWQTPIWLLDEPTEGLDNKTAEALLYNLRQRSKNQAVLLMSHQPRDLAIADAIQSL